MSSSVFALVHHPRRLLVAVLLVIFIYAVYYPELFIITINRSEKLEKYLIFKESWKPGPGNFTGMRCPVKLDPNATEMQQFVKDIPRFDCLQRASKTKALFMGAAFRLERGHYLVRQVDLAGKICCYRQVIPNGDEDVTIKPDCVKITNDVTEILPEFRLIDVLCWLEGNSDVVYYRNGFAPLFTKPNVEQRIQEYEESQKLKPLADDEENLSVIMIGLDSTSQMHFLRKLPKTTKYLTEQLHAIRLNGYNKVAENTLPNILGSLTGRTFKEFREECVEENAGLFKARLDKCAFIWKIFAQKGYRTGFSEDEISISIFNLYFGYAFNNGQPTDFYWRPYSVLHENYIGNKTSYCYGAQLSFEVLMENVKNMAYLFKDKRYFKFTYSTKLGHGEFNAMGWADEPLHDTVNFLHTEGHLNHTALIIIGDHGLRGHDDVLQAMYENRQPAAYIVLPEWFQTRYREAYQNLKENAEDVLTTPYDLYRTLLDFMDLGRLSEGAFRLNPLFVPINDVMKTRGMSLFEKIPPRNCSDAAIPLMWCTCYNRRRIPTNSPLAKRAAEVTIEKMNSVVKRNRKCATLTFTNVSSASIMEGEEANAASGTDVTVIHVVAHASPADVTVETIVVLAPDGQYTVPEEIVRIDWFQGKSKCVGRSLQPFCVCKNYLGSDRKWLFW